ncbi:unnamed protein product [Urochloa decumbens]|uniref:Uncharacterized protein n=1 Tax=Urochloa decumbens TaxID=240449 RepID=A0ABC9A142_9POAL
MAASNGGGGAPLVVFDFDKTIVDCDSDNWVVDALGATRRFDDLLQFLPWNTAIDAMMGELHAAGRTAEDVRACLRAAPLSPHVAAAVRASHARGCELRVLSDANAFFVGTVLAHHGLAAFFSGTDTNPAHIDAAGRLRIRPYHEFADPAAAGHGCTLPSCPPNMCKGKVMKRILREEEEEAAAAAGRRRRRAVVYLGDGRGDYCPSMKLGEGDYVMPRAGYPVCDLIAAAPPAAAVREWDGFEDQERVLLGIVDGEIARAAVAAAEEGEQEDGGAAAAPPAVSAVVLPPDCRAMPAALLPQAVRVPN